MDEDKLIAAVRRFPSLWQTSRISYKDKNTKQSAWVEVGNQMERTPEGCMKRWKALRDRFVRERKKVRCKPNGDAGPCYKSYWTFYEALTFIGDTVKHRGASPNFTASILVDAGANPHSSSVLLEDKELDDEQEEDSVHSIELSASPPCVALPPSSQQQPCVKRPRISKEDEMDENFVQSIRTVQERLARNEKEKQLQKQATPRDESAFFGMQLAATLRRFTYRQRALAKVRIAQVLFEVEFPSDTCHQPATVPQTNGAD